MANEGDVNAARTNKVRSNGGKKNWKGNKNKKINEEMLIEPTLSKVITSHPSSTTKETYDVNLTRRPSTSPTKSSGSQGLK